MATISTTSAPASTKSSRLTESRKSFALVAGDPLVVVADPVDRDAVLSGNAQRLSELPD
jgi:hypothetical protein